MEAPDALPAPAADASIDDAVAGLRRRFADGPGRVLADAPYQRELPAELDVANLAALLREWVAINVREPR